MQFVYNPDLFDTELSDEDEPARSDETLAPMIPEENEEPIPQKNKKKVLLSLLTLGWLSLVNSY